MTDDFDEPDLADLCAPLSAKVMPKSATFGTSNRKVDPAKALAKQRQAAAMKIKRKGKPNAK